MRIVLDNLFFLQLFGMIAMWIMLSHQRVALKLEPPKYYVLFQRLTLVVQIIYLALGLLVLALWIAA